MGPTVRPAEEIVAFELFRLTLRTPVCQNRIEINTCFDRDSYMTEFAKIASAIKMWGWGRAGMILATALLFKHAVTFDQAVILILLNVVLDRLVYGKQPSPRPENRSSAGMAQNRRRPKLLQPIKGRPVGAGGRIGCCAAPRTSSQKERKSPRVGRATYRKHASTNK